MKGRSAASATPDRCAKERHQSAAEIEPLLLDEHQGAALCGVSFWTFREYVQAGEIPTVDLPCPLNPRRKLRRKLIDRADVLAFIARHKSGGAR